MVKVVFRALKWIRAIGPDQFFRGHTLYIDSVGYCIRSTLSCNYSKLDLLIKCSAGDTVNEFLEKEYFSEFSVWKNRSLRESFGTTQREEG